MGFDLIRTIERQSLEAAHDSLRGRLETYRHGAPEAAGAKAPAQASAAADPADMFRRVEPVEICAEDLDAGVLREAVSRGCGLIVRNLVPPEVCAQLRRVIDAMLDAQQTGQERSGYRNCPGNLAEILGHQKLGDSRGFHAVSGSVMCVESANLCEALLELYETLALPPVLRDFFVGDYCLSALKWVLRRSRLPVSPMGWHQDGAFMGSDIKSLNMWMSLSECGADSAAPGLDIVARNLTSVVNAGDGEAAFSWSFDSARMERLFGPDAIASPRFGEGDVYFFDHFMLHRTQHLPGQSRIRYALETWFFDGSLYPSNQVPLSAFTPDLHRRTPC
jgi:hypothetical protein